MVEPGAEKVERLGGFLTLRERSGQTSKQIRGVTERGAEHN
jgi:hypothetical protein